MIKQLLFIACCMLAVSNLSAQNKDIAFANTSEVSVSHKSDQVSIFPNPAIDQIKILNRSGLTLKVSIYNILGDQMIVKNVTKKSLDINISELPVGVYIVSFADKNKVTTQRLVKN